MARFSDEVISRIKTEVSLMRLVEASGVELKPHGKDKIGRCPFHDDKTPSLVVSPESNLWHCLGACQTGGSVIDWVMKMQGVSFRHAVEILRDDIPALAAPTQPVKKSTTKKLDVLLSEDADTQALLNQVTEYYHETLKQTPEALAYLASRGLDNAALIDRFKLGFANRTLGYRLPEKNRKAGAALRGTLQAIGLLRESGHEHFNGSLVVPIINAAGDITELYGRKLLGTKLRKGTAQHLYLPGPHRGVWNEHGLVGQKEIILCEALLDAMTFWVHGFKNVTASYGTRGFTDDHLAAFKQHGIERVLIAYDRDDAGNHAAMELAATLTQCGIDCFRVLFPKGMDANDFAVTMSPPQKALALVIRKAEWMRGSQADAQTTTCAPTITTVAEALATCDTQPPLAAKEKSLIPAHTTHETHDADLSAVAVATPQESALDHAATPMPALPASGVEVQASDHECFITLGDRVYRVRGLEKQAGFDQLKIQLLVRRDEQFHMDKLDLYSSKQRQVFINQACVELGVKDDIIKKDLGKVLLALEEQQAKRQDDTAENKPAELEAEDRKAALALLHDTDLLNRIVNDFKQAGVVGEETNKLAGYLSCVSRKLDRPLAVMIQSSSAAGKSSLMEAILALMPEEERVQYSAMTGQSLFYMGETNLKHKILAISEEEGASNASYALKLLQSEGEVTIASTGKDDSTGNLVTKEYKVEGPVMLFLTTTAIDIDEELLNRCLVLSVNESREQTQAIHAAQRARRTLQGLHTKLEKERIIQLHRNAQRLLKPLAVINPYADQLTFLDDKTRTRRDHEKYLTLIDSIALLHQYQRDIKHLDDQGQRLAYVEVTLDDIAIANRLAHDILGRTLDELPPQTRKLLKHIQTWVQRECNAQGIAQRDFRFSRKSIRDVTQWSDGQLKIHCKRLEDMEYLLVHRGGRGQSMEYELLYTGDIHTDQAQMMGLLDVGQLQTQQAVPAHPCAHGTSASCMSYDEKKLGSSPQKSAPSQGQVRPKSEREKSAVATPSLVYSESGQATHKNALQVG